MSEKSTNMVLNSMILVLFDTIWAVFWDKLLFWLLKLEKLIYCLWKLDFDIFAGILPWIVKNWATIGTICAVSVLLIEILDDDRLLLLKICYVVEFQLWCAMCCLKSPKVPVMPEIYAWFAFDTRLICLRSADNGHKGLRYSAW